MTEEVPSAFMDRKCQEAFMDRKEDTPSDPVHFTGTIQKLLLELK